jgi:hypothetical protein
MPSRRSTGAKEERSLRWLPDEELLIHLALALPTLLGAALGIAVAIVLHLLWA